MSEADKTEKKGFFSKLMEFLEKKLKACAESKTCCCNKGKSGDDSCCSK